MKRQLYKKISEKELSKFYHEWVRKNEFIKFTDWEIKVLNDEIKIDDSKN